MSLLRKVLAGLMVGLGKGMEEQAKIDIQKARDDLLYNRELALKQVEQQYRLQAAEHGSKLDREEAVIGSNLRREEDANRGVIEHGLLGSRQKHASSESAADRAQEERMIRLRGVIDRDNSDAARRAQAAIDSGEIKTTIQDADGNWIGVTKDGKTRPLGIQSHLPESADGKENRSSDDPYGLLRGGGTSTEARTAPQSTAPPLFEQARSKLRTNYGKATPESHPSFFDGKRKRPLGELEGELKTRFGI